MRKSCREGRNVGFFNCNKRISVACQRAVHICEDSDEKYLKSSLGSTFKILHSMNLLRAGQIFIMMKLYRGINATFNITA